jgi:hypothetical protein
VLGSIGTSMITFLSSYLLITVMIYLNSTCIRNSLILHRHGSKVFVFNSNSPFLDGVEAGNRDHLSCPICLLDFEDADTSSGEIVGTVDEQYVQAFPCSSQHLFHASCILEFLISTSLRNSHPVCPCCREGPNPHKTCKAPNLPPVDRHPAANSVFRIPSSTGETEDLATKMELQEGESNLYLEIPTSDAGDSLLASAAPPRVETSTPSDAG